MCHEFGILIDAYKLNYWYHICLMNANKTNIQKPVASIRFSLHTVHRAQYILVRMMKLLNEINFTLIRYFFTRTPSTPCWPDGISLYWPDGCALHLSHTSACVRLSDFKKALKTFRQTVTFSSRWKVRVSNVSCGDACWIYLNGSWGWTAYC